MSPPRSMQQGHLQFAREETLELLLEAEGEGKPAHVGGLPALPEVDNALEVFLRLLLLLLFLTVLLPFAFTLLLLLFFLLILHWHPVPEGRNRG